jgi:hypothetical protein
LPFLRRFLSFWLLIRWWYHHRQACGRAAEWDSMIKAVAAVMSHDSFKALAQAQHTRQRLRRKHSHCFCRPIVRNPSKVRTVIVRKVGYTPRDFLCKLAGTTGSSSLQGLQKRQ